VHLRSLSRTTFGNIDLTNRTLFGSLFYMHGLRCICNDWLRQSRRVGVLLATVISAAGCIESLDTEHSPIGTIERDCVIPAPREIEALSAPSSIEYSGRSLWIWETLSLTEGGEVDTPYARVASADNLCADGPELALNADGKVASLISLTETEQAENDVRSDGRRLKLVPRGGFVDQGTAYLFYDHLLRGPTAFDEQNLGTGLCVLRDEAAPCERVGLPDDTRIFDPQVRVLNRGGLVVDGRALVYGCRSVAALQGVCTVTGAPLDALTVAAKYQVHNDFSGWQTALEQASNISDEIGPITVSPRGRGYLMTVLDIFDSRVYLRHADTPLGPFGRRIPAFQTLPTRGGFPGGGREHAGLSRDPQTIHLTYTTDDPSAPGLHIVTFRSFGEFWE